mgnify:CR=1 FL=1
MDAKVAVLTSGGVDSAVLLADLAESATVYPIYVRAGLFWEDAEHRALEAFIVALGNPNVQPITSLSVSVGDIYGDHWSVTGKGVPGLDEPATAIFMPGRNVLLIGLAAVWCSSNRVPRLAIGTLNDSPFSDATPEFFQRFGQVLSQGLGYEVTVEAPYRQANKEDVIRVNRHLPLGLTLSCMSPRDGLNCGDCGKCWERRLAFQRAGVPDPTRYAAE